MTIGVIVHDKMSDLRQSGDGGWKLRHEARTRFGMIYPQVFINDSEMGGEVKFKFERCHKTTEASHETKFVHLRFELLQRADSVEHEAVFQPPKSRTPLENSNKMTNNRRGVDFVKSTTEEDMHNPTVQGGHALEILKSSRTLRPKTDTQATRLVCMSPQNPWFGKLSMEEKGKNVNMETDDEEEDLQAFVKEIEVDEKMEEDI